MNPIMKMALLQQQRNYSPYGVKTKYLSFDGVDDYAEIADAENIVDLLHGTSAITVDLWFNQQVLPIDTSYRNTLFLLLNGQTCVHLSVWRNADPTYPCWLYVGGRSQSTDSAQYAGVLAGAYSNTTDTWYHLEAELNFVANTIYFWINGAFIGGRGVSFGSSAFVKAASNYQIWLGKTGTAKQWHNGYLDEVRIWRGTRADIKATRSGWETGLVLFNKLNDGSGSVLTDSSRYGNHGTVSGAIFV